MSHQRGNSGDSLSPEQVALLAAYLDGAVSDEERGEVEALMAGSEVAREVAAEAVALEGGRRPSRGRRALVLVPLAAAASLALLIPVSRSWAPDWTSGVRVEGAIPSPSFTALGMRSGDPAAEPPLAGSGARAGAFWATIRSMAASDRTSDATEVFPSLRAELETQLASGPVIAELEVLRGAAPRWTATGAIDARLRNLYDESFSHGFVLQSLVIAVGTGDRSTVRRILQSLEASATLSAAATAGFDADLAVLAAVADPGEGPAPSLDDIAASARRILDQMGS